jgi:hypothetical protein
VGISPGGGSEPVWSPTGREIFYRSLDGRRMMAVEMGTTPGFIASMPRQLFEFEGRYRARSGAFWFNYDVSRDGLSFLMVVTERSNAATEERLKSGHPVGTLSII